jgi:tellurite resistance protein TerC
LLALILVETTDVMFAIDSIPAILAITRDPFLVFTSNVFAILGLRSLYFALAGMMDRFRYLKMSLVFLLAYIGVKMLLSHYYPIPNLVSLAFIGGILVVGIVASLIVGTRDPAALLSPVMDELEHLTVLTYHQARKVVILIVGSAILLTGIAMIVLPGPAILVIPLGLTVLALEFAWARLWLRRFRKKAQELKRDVGNQFKKWTGGRSED